MVKKYSQADNNNKNRFLKLKNGANHPELKALNI